MSLSYFLTLHQRSLSLFPVWCIAKLSPYMATLPDFLVTTLIPFVLIPFKELKILSLASRCHELLPNRQTLLVLKLDFRLAQDHPLRSREL